MSRRDGALHGTTRRPRRRDVLGAGAGLAGSAALSACGVGPGSRPADTITMAYTNNEVTRTQLEQAVEDFRAVEPDVTVELSLLPEGALDAWLTTRTIAGQAPDIVELGVSAVSRYAANGTAVDIEPYLPDGYVEGYLPTLRALVDKDDGVFGLPRSASCLTVYYRTDVVEQLGLDVPATPEQGWSWEEFRSICEEAQRVTGAYGLSYGFINANSGNRWAPLLYQLGGGLFDEQGRPSVDTDEGREALRWFSDFYADGLISLSNTVKASQTDTATGLFVTGQVGVMVHESQVLELSEQLADEEWGATYLFRDVELATSLGGNVNIVTSSSRNPELATRFLQFATDRDRTIASARRTGSVVPFTGVDPEDIGYETRPEEMAISTRQLASVPEAVGRDMAARDYQTVREVLGDNLDLLFIGQASVEETAEAIDEGLRNA